MELRELHQFELRELIYFVAVAEELHCPRASGTYIARGQGFVLMLQITQAQSGQLLGSLSALSLTDARH